MTKVFWLFGRSGAGKTTLGRRLHQSLLDRKIPVFYLDGDELRHGLCSDLTFTPSARLENHRRIAEVARLAADQHLNVIVTTMAPQHSQRDIAAQVLGERLVWIYVHAPLEVCIRRDPKGLTDARRPGSWTDCWIIRLTCPVRGSGNILLTLSPRMWTAPPNQFWSWRGAI
ncbi:MAG TPA: adenylyl-sulfate kinase [Verrucomicrobiae bacterium]|nr:adenylyl-sulfate kinase [Verrucomicrobiae bacterium]